MKHTIQCWVTGGASKGVTMVVVEGSSEQADVKERRRVLHFASPLAGLQPNTLLTYRLTIGEDVEGTVMR